MRKLSALALAVALAVFVPSPGHAQGGLLLHWNGCSADGAKDQFFACNANDGEPFVLYASLFAPDTLPGLQSASFKIHVAIEGGALVPWWQTEFGACRSEAIDVPFQPGEFQAACADFWASDRIGGTFQVREPLASGFALTLYGAGLGTAPGVGAAGPERVVLKLTLDRSKSTGPDACAGCFLGAEIVFAECVLAQRVGLPTYVITQPAWPGAARVTWNGGAPVAVANRTWGAIKQLYR